MGTPIATSQGDLRIPSLLGMDAVGGKGGRRENGEQLWALGLRNPGSLGSTQGSFRTGEGAGCSESIPNPFVPHTQASRAEVNTPNTGSKAGVLRGPLPVRGLCIWWVVLAVDCSTARPQ